MESRRKQEIIQEVTLDEFERPDFNTWRETVEKDLKGTSFEKKLVRKSPENIDIQPLYTKENSSAINDEMPGSFPYTRGSSPIPKTPFICQKIGASTPQQLNKILRNNVSRGQNGVYLQFNNTVDDIITALDGLDLTKLYLHIDMGSAGLSALNLLASGIEKLGFKIEEISGAILCDPHQLLISEGMLSISLNEIYSDLAEMLRQRANLFPKCAMIGVDVSIVRESGGSAKEELAVAVASAVEYIRALAKHDFEIDEIGPEFMFSMTTGSDFFMEIAKFRAARRLWAQIVSSCGGDAGKAPFKVNVSGQHWNKTIYDPYVNMLRTTTESFAAILGGADSLHSVAFDEVFSLTDEFSQRIARNTQIILNEESHASEVIDPAGGSWYIENLTDQLAREAWQLFREIEKQGGLIKALQNGFIQQKIEKVAEQKKERIAQRKDGIIGTSLFANLDEKLPERKTIKETAKKDFSEKEGSGLQVKSLKKVRAAEDYEALRQASEKYKAKNGDYPAVVLATIGPVSQHRTRTDFTVNFLIPAGFRVVESGVYSDSNKVLDAIKKTSAKAVVICSTDETYSDCVPSLAKAIKEYDDSIQVIVAGFPEKILDDLRESGVDDFVHIRTDNLKFLQQLQLKTEIAL